MFAGKGCDAAGLKELKGDLSQVKVLSGTSLGQQVVAKLKLKKKDGSLIAQIDNGDQAASKWGAAEIKLGDKEEIIGIFGSRNDSHISRLGFIVWQPPAN